MRLLSLFLVACLLPVSNAGAQSPSDGHIQGDAYVNSYFRISYRWPKILQPYNIASLQLPQKSRYGNEFLLFSARQGNLSYGVILIAEKLNVQTTQHPKGIKDAADMMDWILRFDPQQHVNVLSKKHFTGVNGFVFDEVDYTENGVYSAAIVTQVKNFALAFKCDAQSLNDLAKMTASVAELERSK